MTAAEYQTLILIELNASDNAIALANMSNWWSMFSSKTPDYLIYLYTKRQVVLYLVGYAWSKYDVQLGFDAFKKSQVFQHLMGLYKLLTDEIKILDPIAAAAPLQFTQAVSNLPNMGSGFYEDLNLLEVLSA